MISAIRRLFSSKLGAAIALGFVLMMGLAFAVTDVNTFMSGASGVATGNVARVGDREISAEELRQRIDQAYERQRQDNPGLSRDQFIAGGAVDSVLEEVVDLYAIEQYARANGFGVDKATVDGIIARNPAYAGLDGNFSQDVFAEAVRQQGLTELDMRRNIETAVIARQLIGPLSSVTGVPDQMTLAYASLQLERREGQATFIPAARLRPTTAPTAAQLQAQYRSQRVRYTIPERRAIRYALLDESAVRTVPTVTAQEIAADFRTNAAQFAASESRRLSQVIVPTRAIADRIAAAARGGQSLSAAAQAAGLSAATVNAANQQRYAATTNAATARAVFTARQGALLGPQQIPLGFVVVRVEAVESRAAMTLAAATPAIRARLLERKKQEALVDLYNRIQDSLHDGVSVAEVAETHGLTVQTTPPLTSTGGSPGNPAFRPEPLLAMLIGPAFQSGEGDPAQIVPVAENRVFALVEIAQNLPEAPPPLAQIRERVTADWALAEGARQARTRARAIQRAVESGTPFATAATAQGASDGVQALNGQRLDLTRQDRRAPPEIALLFSMTTGTAKTLELPNNAGWLVLTLNRIIRGDATGNQALITAMGQELRAQVGEEHIRALIASARRSVGVEIDSEAVTALRRLLTGASDAPNS